MTMCTCIILIVNVPPEKEGIDQFMWGREDKEVNNYHCLSYTSCVLIIMPTFVLHIWIIVVI